MGAMKSCEVQTARRDDLVGSKVGWLVWGLPLLLLVAGGVWDESRAWLWTPALVVAGLACLTNAARCGRLHCYITGPLYLLAAVATLFEASGLLALGWNRIAMAIVGGTVLAYIPEWVWRKYVRKPA